MSEIIFDIHISGDGAGTVKLRLPDVQCEKNGVITLFSLGTDILNCERKDTQI